MTRHGLTGVLKIPSQVTLNKYGLTEAEWMKLAKAQGGVCFVCQRLPISGRLNVDHEHVHKWRFKPPEERKKYVRGLLCYNCNRHHCSRGMTVEKAEGVARYLARYKEWTLYSTHPLRNNNA